MQPAKLCLAAACILAAASARLSAQGFDGAIQFVTYGNHTDRPDTMTQITKGSKIRFEGLGKNGAAMIIDGTNRLILIPEQKQYMEVPMSLGGRETAEAAKHQGSAERTGKTENIAGIPCQVWHYKRVKDDGSREEGDVWVAKGAGLMISRLSGGYSAHYFNAGGQAFSDEMEKGAGVMKVTTNGKVAFVAVSAKATSVPDAMFAPPPGYTRMDAARMGGPPRKP